MRIPERCLTSSIRPYGRFCFLVFELFVSRLYIIRTSEFVSPNHPVKPSEEAVAVVGETELEIAPESEPALTTVPEEQDVTTHKEFEQQTGFARWFSLHPTLILQTVYVVIGASIVFALALMVRREAHLRHRRSVVTGIVLILVMIVLTYITREYTLPMQFFASF